MHPCRAANSSEYPQAEDNMSQTLTFKMLDALFATRNTCHRRAAWVYSDSLLIQLGCLFSFISLYTFHKSENRISFNTHQAACYASVLLILHRFLTRQLIKHTAFLSASQINMTTRESVRLIGTISQVHITYEMNKAVQNPPFCCSKVSATWLQKICIVLKWRTTPIRLSPLHVNWD